jgi:hypothetical protein
MILVETFRSNGEKKPIAIVDVERGATLHKSVSQQQTMPGSYTYHMSF